ncbi:MAG: TetR/AcrR family transcriptional regulator [Rhodothermales bacterium]|nr:TetR/AcrR family transcriptional regulator [Rhodothermales bacterium]
MPTQRTSRPDLHRAILDAARALLHRDGYAGLSMRNIAGAIGYSATSIYLHFENKEALFNALIDEGMGLLHEDLDAVEASGGHVLDRFRALCDRYMQFGLRRPEYYEIMFLLHPERNARFPVDMYRRARRNLDYMVHVLREGRQQGFFVVEDIRVAASGIWASLHGAVSLLLAQRIDVGINRESFIAAVIQQQVQSVTAAMPAVSR